MLELHSKRFLNGTICSWLIGVQPVRFPAPRVKLHQNFIPYIVLVCNWKDIFSRRSYKIELMKAKLWSPINTLHCLFEQVLALLSYFKTWRKTAGNGTQQKAVTPFWGMVVWNMKGTLGKQKGCANEPMNFLMGSDTRNLCWIGEITEGWLSDSNEQLSWQEKAFIQIENKDKSFDC